MKRPPLVPCRRTLDGGQPSAGNIGSTGSFYVNVGVGLDALWQLAGDAIPEKPPRTHASSLGGSRSCSPARRNGGR